MLTIYQRPFARQKHSIGKWQGILRLLARIGVVTNGFIVAFGSSTYKDNLDYLISLNSPSEQDKDRIRLFAQLATVMIFEHVVFFFAVSYIYNIIYLLFLVDSFGLSCSKYSV